MNQNEAVSHVVAYRLCDSNIYAFPSVDCLVHPFLAVSMEMPQSYNSLLHMTPVSSKIHYCT
jgi:hypothetical protein